MDNKKKGARRTALGLALALATIATQAIAAGPSDRHPTIGITGAQFNLEGFTLETLEPELVCRLCVAFELNGNTFAYNGMGCPNLPLDDCAATPPPPPNTAPVAGSSAVDAPMFFSVPLGLTAPTDAENDALTITVTAVPARGQVMNGGVQVNAGDVLTSAQLTALSYIVDDDAGAGSALFTYSVSDGHSTVSGQTTITISPNLPPVVENSSAGAMMFDGCQAPRATLNIPAPTEPEGEAMTITVTGLPSRGDAYKAGAPDLDPLMVNDTLTVAELTGLEYRICDEGPGEIVTFTYTVTDGHPGHSVTGTVDIDIFGGL